MYQMVQSLLKKKGFKEERMTKVGVCAIDQSTTLESNKSLLLSCRRAARSHLHVSWCPRGHDNSKANGRQNRQSPATRSTWARSLRPAPSRNGSGTLGAPMAPSTHPGNRSPELRGGQRGTLAPVARGGDPRLEDCA